METIIYDKDKEFLVQMTTEESLAHEFSFQALNAACSRMVIQKSSIIWVMDRISQVKITTFLNQEKVSFSIAT